MLNSSIRFTLKRILCQKEIPKRESLLTILILTRFLTLPDTR